MYRRVKGMTRTLVAVALPLALLAVSAPTVLADNEPYDGTDPHTTGCDTSAWTPYSRSADGGTLELRFSNGCLTAWARFTCWNSGGCTNYTLWVQRVQDQKSETQYVTWPNYTDYGTTLYTLQLYDGGSYQSYACIQGYFGAQAYCTSAY